MLVKLIQFIRLGNILTEIEKNVFHLTKTDLGTSYDL